MTDLLRFSFGWKDAGRRLKSSLLPICVLALLITICPRFVMAQELAATLSGQVTDATGAVIPHASIAISLNGVNGIVKTIESDGAGNYVASNLTAGTYAISVTAKGFETYKARNIVLNVAEKHAVNVQLKPGAADTTITVEDNPISVDLESSAQAGTITGVQLRELEISDRNFAMLVVLQPGVVNAGLGDEANTESNTGISVSGARPMANNWTVDGADVNDSGSNQTVVNAPSIDAINEFTLQRGNYDAGYGRSGGGQILVSTKNGTSSFHGDAYEFLRNTDLDANDTFNKNNPAALSPRAVNHHNDYGFTVGGPIYIPGHYNTNKQKTFFFYSQEWQKITAPIVSTGVVGGVNANEENHIIADAQVMDNNGNPTGNYIPYMQMAGAANSCAGITHDGVNHQSLIPASCITGVNQALYNAKVFAPFMANSGAYYNYNASQKNNFQQEILRLDHNFNDKLHLFLRGMEDSAPSQSIGGMWMGPNAPGLADLNTNTPGKNVVANLTWTINSHMVNELEAVYAEGEYVATPPSGEFFDNTADFAALTNGGKFAYMDFYKRMPAVTIANVAAYNSAYGPYHERNLDRSIFDNFTYTLGRHTLRAGFNFQAMLKTENGTGGNASFSFNNSSSAGDATTDHWNADPSWSFADFLLSNVTSYSQASKDTIPGLHYINSEAYLQDDWKVNHKLTVNLGIRWSSFPAPADNRNTLVNFDPLAYSNANAPAITTGIGGGNFVLPAIVTPSTLIPATYANGLILPQGATCAAGKAIASTASCSPYGAKVNPNDYRTFAPRVGFAYNPDGKGKTSIRGGFGMFYDRVLNGIWEDDSFVNPPLVQTTTINNGSFDNILGGTAATNATPNNLYVTGTPNFRVPNYADYNLSVQRQILPTSTVEIAYVGNQARHLTGQSDLNQPMVSQRVGPGADIADDVNFLRPFKGYGAMTNVSPIYTSNYNGLQVSANHKAHGLQLGLAYTWSKTMTTMSYDRGAAVSNTHNIKMDYGPSNWNTPQVFEASYVYDLPWYASQHGVIGHLAGGWEVSGITSMISGVSLTVTQGEDPFNVGGNRGIGLAQEGNLIRVNQNGPVHLTKQFNQWFDPSSFSKASGAFGTEHNGAFLGPGLQRWDIAAIKNLKIYGPAKLQIRSELFNAFNHVNYNGIGTNIDSPTGPNGGSFGTVTSDHGPRIIQVAAKVIF